MNPNHEMLSTEEHFLPVLFYKYQLITLVQVPWSYPEHICFPLKNKALIV